MRRRHLLFPPLLALALLAVGATAALAATAAHWNMNEPAGYGFMLDDSGNGNTGTWENITANGSRYLFNGTTSRVIVPDNPNGSLDPGAQPFSYSVTFNTSVVPDATVGDFDLLRKGLGSTKGGYYKVELYPTSDHTRARPLCQLQGNTGAAKLVIGVNPVTGKKFNLADGIWHTITCKKDDGGLTMVVDDVQVGFKAATIGSIANSAPLTIGAKQDAGGDWYNGLMDRAKVKVG
jgi:Concanavalin A-like lectin/glucanases superfamily